MNTEFNYLVVEDSRKVCEGIQERMEAFSNWHACSFAHHVDDAWQIISNQRPELIFIDWSLKGGSAFEVLQQVQNIQGYNPFIIFNTGFQSDNPEIPQEIINHYKVDKYLVKPFWEKLRLFLADYVAEAEKKALKQFADTIIFITDSDHVKTKVNLLNLICICKDPTDSSKKTLFFDKNSTVRVKATWPAVLSILDKHKLDYFVTNKKEHLVVKTYIEEYNRPLIFLKGFPRKIEVVKDRLHRFEEWLEEGGEG